MQTKYPHSSLLATSTNIVPTGGNLGAKGGKNKRTASSLRLQDTSSVLGEGGGAGEDSGEGGEVPKEAQVYVDAKTYVYLEIELHRPLIPRRPASVLAERYTSIYSTCVHACSFSFKRSLHDIVHCILTDYWPHNSLLA